MNVGDKVFVVDYQPGIKPMAMMLGRTCTIESDLKGTYTLKEDIYKFYWKEEYLEPCNDFIIPVEDWMKILGG